MPLLTACYHHSWRLYNPGWRMQLLDDSDLDAFIRLHFDQAFADAFAAMPLGVMRADVFRCAPAASCPSPETSCVQLVFTAARWWTALWHVKLPSPATHSNLPCRIAAVHLYCGVYTDLDTETFTPVETWLQPVCNVALALEPASSLPDGTPNDEWFCQWTFAAKPRHPLIGSVWDVIHGNIMAGNYNTSDENVVHDNTGPAAFTVGVTAYLTKAIAPVSLGHNLTAWVQEHRQQARKQGVCIYTAQELFQSVDNHYSSQHKHLRPPGEQGWTELRDKVVQSARSRPATP